VSSFPRAAPLQLRLRDEENDDQHIKNNVVNLLFPAPIFLLASAFASICTIWSEYSEIATGCGPRSLPDALERGSYLGVLVVAGLSVFVRIVSGQRLSDVYAKETSKTTGMGLFAQLLEPLLLCGCNHSKKNRWMACRVSTLTCAEQYCKVFTNSLIV